MEASRWTCVVCGEREEYDRQLHLAEVLAELAAVCRKGRIWLQCIFHLPPESAPYKVTCSGISGPDCECECDSEQSNFICKDHSFVSSD